MSAEPLRVMPAKIAHKPAGRTVTVTGTGEWTEWRVTAKADFPARLLVDLASGDIDRIIRVFDAIVVEHNFPNADGELADSMADVDPWDGLMVMAGAIFDGISKLPSR